MHTHTIICRVSDHAIKAEGLSTYPTVTQTSNDISKRQQALVDCASLSLPQLVVSIIFHSQCAALTASQVHKVQSRNLQIPFVADISCER